MLGMRDGVCQTRRLGSSCLTQREDASCEDAGYESASTSDARTLPWRCSMRIVQSVAHEGRCAVATCVHQDSKKKQNGGGEHGERGKRATTQERGQGEGNRKEDEKTQIPESMNSKTNHNQGKPYESE